MILERIADVFRGGGKPKLPVPAPPDPATEFRHAENEPLFERLKRDSKVAAPDKDPLWVLGGYEVRAHPDLVEILCSLIGDSEVRRGSAYGRPVTANTRGLVFAYAGGTHYIFLKLGEERRGSARQDGGRWDPTYGQDWIEFCVGGRAGVSSDWREALHRWFRISYQDSPTIE
jgi:hypothetical protein